MFIAGLNWLRIMFSGSIKIWKLTFGFHKAGNFFTSWVPVKFYVNTLHEGVRCLLLC
jgi:hypothetical protein